MRLRFWMAALLLCLTAAPLFAAPLIARNLAPPWQTQVDGKIFRFSPDHLQRPAILLFWATWCPYCEALMPHLQNVADAAGKDKLDVYAIDIKDDDGDPAATLRARKLTFTLVRDGDNIAERYGVKGTPGLFLVGANGDIIYSRSGGDAPEKVEAMLREKLGLAPTEASKNN